MKQRGKGRGKRSVVLPILILMPVCSVLLCMLAAFLTLKGVLPEKQLDGIAAAVVAVVCFGFSFYGAMRASQKRFLWGMIYTGAYAAMLLLGNLLFFGVAYSGVKWILISVFGSGFLAAFLAGAKKRKNA